MLRSRSVFTKTESPAYAPASASILFPGFRFAAERRDFPRPTRKNLAASRRKVRTCEPLSASIMFPGYKLAQSGMIERLSI